MSHTCSLRSSIRSILPALLLLCLGCTERDPSQTFSDRPNLLVVMSDTHRADHVFTDPEDKESLTPNLSRLAALGTTFTDVLSVAPISAPGYASLMTGKRPSEHGVLNNAQTLSPALPVLGEKLREAGYATSAVVSNSYCAERFGFARGFDLFWDEVQGRGQWGRHVTDEAIRWLNERPEDQPFFLFTAYMDAHKPYFYDDTPVSLAVFLNGLEVARLAAENRYVLNRIPMQLVPGDNEVELRFLKDGAPASPSGAMSPLLVAEFSLADPGPVLVTGMGLEPVEHTIHHFRMQNLGRIRIDNPSSESLATELVFRCHREYSRSETPELYRRGIASFDSHLGRLLDHLSAQALLKDTVVVMLADHGEMLGEHGRWSHVDHLYPGTLNIPLIVKGRGFPGGSVSEQPLDLLDIHHLILRLANGLGWQGYEPLQAHGARIAATYPPEARELLVSVQDSRYRLLSNGIDRWMLFDLQEDSNETKNLFPELSGDPRIETLVEQLRQELVRIQAAEFLDLDSLDPKDVEELRALGYL